MTADSPSAVVVGGGAFGVSTALALAVRKWRVTLVDPGPVPHPRASSTDRSRIVRMDYGHDRVYAAMAEEALATWRVWNAMRGAPLYHEVGFLLLSRDALEPGGFEYESRKVMEDLGVRVDTLSGADVAERFPAWPADAWAEGYWNPQAGWAESGAAVAWLARRARAAGVEFVTGARVVDVVREGGRATGVALESAADGAHDGGDAGTAPVGPIELDTPPPDRIDADHVIVAAGAWTPSLLPEMADVMRVVGQPVFHLRPDHPAPFAGKHFPPWGGDIARTGWYGLPAVEGGLVKVAHHGVGVPVDPGAWPDGGPLPQISGHFEERLRVFLRDRLPLLAEAPVAERRLCLYCDTFDGDFWIDRHPDVEGLSVVAGGSGHGFKFCPLIGDIAADLLEGHPNPWAGRFGWRTPEDRTTEHARSSADPFSRDAPEG